MVPSFQFPATIMFQPDIDSAPKSPHDMSSESADSALSMPELQNLLSDMRQVPMGGRAAKRQRGRERRKLYKAQKRLEADAACDKPTTCLEADASCETPTMVFDERAAAVAAEFKLVVKSTFFDVLEETVETDVSLPAPLFQTTPEVDQWRRDYRRFRLGHHHGAKGEIPVGRIVVEDAMQRLNLEARASVRCGSHAAKTHDKVVLESCDMNEAMGA
jgi:hypothetical protein